MMMATPMIGGAARAMGVNDRAVAGAETGLGIAGMGIMTGNHLLEITVMAEVVLLVLGFRLFLGSKNDLLQGQNM